MIIFGYVVSLRSAWATWEPFLKGGEGMVMAVMASVTSQPDKPYNCLGDGPLGDYLIFTVCLSTKSHSSLLSIPDSDVV